MAQTTTRRKRPATVINALDLQYNVRATSEKIRSSQRCYSLVLDAGCFIVQLITFITISIKHTLF